MFYGLHLSLQCISDVVTLSHRERRGGRAAATTAAAGAAVVRPPIPPKASEATLAVLYLQILICGLIFMLPTF